MDRLNVVITMDCEPTTELTHGSATGPASWALGERAVTGIAEIARSYGLPMTYFVHPETADAQRELFTGLRRDGAGIGELLDAVAYDDDVALADEPSVPERRVADDEPSRHAARV